MRTQNLAESTDRSLLDGLRELANLRDEPAAIERFERRWPELAEKPTSIPQGFSMGGQESTYVAVLRTCLRKIWTGGPDANSLLTAFFLTSSPIVDLIRPWPPIADPITKALPSHPLVPKGSFEADWRRSGLVYHPETQLQKALYLLLQSSARAKVCANPDCPAPYFIAKKLRERYCSLECVRPFQRQSKLDWWNRVGRERRSKRSTPKRRSKRSTPKQRSGR
jgi:hypothetical protein